MALVQWFLFLVSVGNYSHIHCDGVYVDMHRTNTLLDYALLAKYNVRFVWSCDIETA